MCGAFAFLPNVGAGQVLCEPRPRLATHTQGANGFPTGSGGLSGMREQGWRRFGWYVWDSLHGLRGDWNGRLSPSHEFIFHFNRRA